MSQRSLNREILKIKCRSKNFQALGGRIRSRKIVQRSNRYEKNLEKTKVQFFFLGRASISVRQGSGHFSAVKCVDFSPHLILVCHFHIIPFVHIFKKKAKTCAFRASGIFFKLHFRVNLLRKRA